MLRRLLLSTCALATMLLMAAASASSATADSFCAIEFPLPSSNPGWLTRGPDGNVWFIHDFGSSDFAIGKITPAGRITDFPVPGTPVRIASGPDGNLWYTRSDVGTVGRMTLSGSVTLFTLPAGASSLYGITAGPDGNLWITEQSGNQILQSAVDGTVGGQFPIPTANSSPTDIVPGADGNLYFIEQAVNKIGRITPAGVFAEFAITTSRISLGGITPGPDGNVWFTEISTCGLPPGNGCTVNNRLSKIEPNGTVTEYDDSYYIRYITAGSDGNLWGTVEFKNSDGYVGLTPDGAFASPVGSNCRTPFLCFGFTSIASGGDGNIWLGKSSPGVIVTFDPRTRLCIYIMPQVSR